MYYYFPEDVSGLFMMKDGSPRSVYIVEDHIHTQPEKQFIECCVHGKLQFKEQAPELVCSNAYTVLPALRCHLRFLAIKPFLLGVKTSGFKRKLCFIESTIVPN